MRRLWSARAAYDKRVRSEAAVWRCCGGGSAPDAVQAEQPRHRRSALVREVAFSVTPHRAQARSYEAGYRNRIRRDTGKAITRLIPIGM